MPNPLYDTLFGRHAAIDATFLIRPDGSTVSYRAFVELGQRFAARLDALGLEAGARIAVQVPKSIEALALYAAAAQTGIVFLPLNTAYTAAEVDYFVENAGAKLLVADPARAADLAPVAAAHQCQLETMGAASDGSFVDAARTLSPRQEVTPRAETDLAAFLYTSGTTGRSKGAMLSQGNLLSNAEALRASWAFTATDTLLHALPIFHTHGLFVGTNITLLAGGAMIFLPGFQPDAVFEALPKATTMMGVPTFYTRMLDDDRLSQISTEHMRLFISGSAPLRAEDHAAFAARTGHAILERYGMTETNMNTSNPYDGARRAGTVGLPLPGVEVRITNPGTGEALPTGEIGMIEVRGPNVFQGYWGLPEKTREELRESGFFITGDLGQMSEDGYLSIVGRGKDLIIAGGYNIYPKEVETAIDAIPGVAESAVIGVPHRDMGEGVVAVIVQLPDSDLTEDDITAPLSQSLARFKQPRHIAFVDALPRNTMGKVQKAALRERFATAFNS